MKNSRGEDLSPEIFRLSSDGERNMKVPDNDPAGLGCFTIPSSEGPGCALWYSWGGRSRLEPELSKWQVLQISRRCVCTCWNPVIAMGIMFYRASKIQANS